jgi:hypothetical protein
LSRITLYAGYDKVGLFEAYWTPHAPQPWGGMSPSPLSTYKATACTTSACEPPIGSQEVRSMFSRDISFGHSVIFRHCHRSRSWNASTVEDTNLVRSALTREHRDMLLRATSMLCAALPAATFPLCETHGVVCYGPPRQPNQGHLPRSSHSCPLYPPA